MVEKILKLLEHQSYSINSLEERLQIDKQELEVILEEMQKQGLIYYNMINRICMVNENQLVGRLDSDSKGKKFVRNKKEKIFISSDNLHTAFKNDLVVCDTKQNNIGIVVGILERKNTRLVCEVISKRGKLALVPFNVGCEVSLSLNDKKLLKNFVEGDRVVVELDNKVDENNIIIVKSATRIGHKDDPKSDELAIAISKDFDIDFSEETIKEIINIPNIVREEDKIGRLDLTKDITFTIDSVHTKDMDDAISIKKLYNGNYLLGVHIADVSYYVKPGSSLFKDALKRGTSLYLGDTVIPMIPHKLSNGICSLNEGVDRLTKTVYMEINDKGRILNYKIVDSVINSKKKMTYEELNEIFKNGECDKDYAPFATELCLMRELSKILTKARNQRGNIDFASNDLKVSNNEEEMPIEFTERGNEEAENLIENFMIAANETIATYFYWRDLPFIYRIHNIPDEIKLEQTMELIQTIGPKMIKLQNAYGQKAIQSILDKYKGTPEYAIISNLLLRNMAKAQYSTRNIGHFALALDNYCHFTSPIRRFPDLAIHHLLNIFNNDYTKYNQDIVENLDYISSHSSYKERQADEAERDYLKLKMAEFMANHIGEDFEGIILDIDRDSVIIKLENNVKGVLTYSDEFSQAFIIDSFNKELKCAHSKNTVKLGAKVTVRVDDVNIPQKEVYFELREIHKYNKLSRKLPNSYE